MKFLTDNTALQLTEALLQNDKDIKSELEQKIPNIKGYATENFVTTAIANAQLSDGNVNVNLSSYYTKDETYSKSEVNDALTKKADTLHTHDQYLTEHQSLENYALKTEIPTDYLSSIPDEYVTEEKMTEAINNAKLDGESVDLSDYAKKTDIPTSLPASDVYEWAKAETKPEYTANEVGALSVDTEIPSLDGYAKTSDIPDVTNFVEKEDGKGLFSGNYDDLINKPTIPKGYDDTVLTEMIEDIEISLNSKADKTEIPNISNYVEKETGKGLFSGSYNDLDNKPTINGIELNGNKTASDLGIITQIPVISNFEGIVGLEPNKMYVFGEATSLDIALVEPSDTTIVNEYMFSFDSGNTATEFSYSTDIIFNTEFTIESNKHYEVSIVNGYGLIVGF